MDALASRDERGLRRTAKPCGPDAPTLASSWRSDPQAMVAIKPGHQGERVISRKPLRREGRIVSANLWRLRSCAFCSAREAMGAASTRLSLRPPFFRGRSQATARARGAAASRNCAAEEPLSVVNGYGLRRNDDRVA